MDISKEDKTKEQTIEALLREIELLKIELEEVKYRLEWIEDATINLTYYSEHGEFVDSNIVCSNCEKCQKSCCKCNDILSSDDREKMIKELEAKIENETDKEDIKEMELCIELIKQGVNCRDRTDEDEEIESQSPDEKGYSRTSICPTTKK